MNGKTVEHPRQAWLNYTTLLTRETIVYYRTDPESVEKMLVITESTHAMNRTILGQLLSFPVIFISLFLHSVAVWAQEPPAQNRPDKYALLIGVTDYAKPELNTGLKFPEDDAQSLATVLRKGGFTVEELLGKAATKKAIDEKLKKLSNRGGNNGVIFVGLCGHGTEFAETGKSYFCPYDTMMSTLRDQDNKVLNNEDGTPKVAFNVESLVSIDDILIALGDSNSSNRILVADCCRDDLNRARGRSFGTSLDSKRLPTQTLMLLGCSSQEKSLEHDSWEHGALTKCLLDEMNQSLNSKRTMGSIAEDVIPAVQRLVSSTGKNNKQTPRLLNTGRVELMLRQSLEQEINNSIGMKLTLISAGEFMMGNEESVSDLLKAFPYAQKEWFEDASKRHKVKITKPYYMGVHEVTVGQFRKFVESSGYKTEAESDGKGGYGIDDQGNFHQSTSYNWKNPGFKQSDDHPVVNVSWNDTQKFMEWLSKKEGRQYRLPTEAEWEYACRAGTQTRYWNGNDPEELAKIGNVRDRTAKQKYSGWAYTISSSDGYANTAPVGSFTANPWGLHDMHGNVWEWCLDWYDEYGSDTVHDPTGPSTGSFPAYRGGSWDGNASGCRSAIRNWFSPGIRGNDLGFRVALVPPSQ